MIESLKFQSKRLKFKHKCKIVCLNHEFSLLNPFVKKNQVYILPLFEQILFKKSKIIEQQSQQNGIYTPQLVPSIKSVRTR